MRENMNKKRVYILLTIVFLTLIIASSSIYYKYTSIPKSTTVKIYLFSGDENAEYNYTAYLKPNNIYDNLTSISNEEYVYTKLIQNISVTFKYNASFDENGNISLKYYTFINLISPKKWSKTFNRTKMNSINLNGDRGSITLDFNISPSKYLSIAKEISDETGTPLQDIIIEIVPHIEMQFIDKASKEIKDVTEPKFQIKLLKNSDKGVATYFEGFQHNKNTPLYDEKIILNDIPTADIYTSLGVLIISLSGLLSTDYFYIKSYGTPKIRRKTSILKYIKKILRENDDIIIETQVNPDKEYKMYSLVRLPNIDDLIKISEMLSKPILYFHDSSKQYVFYLLDEKQRYQYEIFSEGGYVEEKK